MIIFRLIGLVLIIAALMLLGADVVTTLETGGDLMSGALTVRSFDQALALASVDIKPWIEATLPNPVSAWLTTALAWPSWAVTGVPGVVFTMLGGSGD